MRVRELRESDIPILNEIAARSGFPYPDLCDPHIESAAVVVDDEDRPVMACAAQRIAEMYLWVGDCGNPALALHAIRLLHDDLSVKLHNLGYDSVEAYLPPALERSFGRRLERCFGWTRNWRSWNRRTDGPW